MWNRGSVDGEGLVLLFTDRDGAQIRNVCASNGASTVALDEVLLDARHVGCCKTLEQSSNPENGSSSRCLMTQTRKLALTR